MFLLSDAQTGLVGFDRLISEMEGSGVKVEFDGAVWTEYTFRGGVDVVEQAGIDAFKRASWVERVGDFYRTTFGTTVCDFTIAAVGRYHLITMAVYE